MTLNAWALPWPFARARARRFARMARHFAARPYHLIGVQEAWWPLGRRAVPGLRRGGGWPDSGLALGGTLAQGAELELLRFDRGSGADRLAGKGLLRARIGDLLVGVTHLQAGDAVMVRLRQVEQLVGWLDRRLSDLPAVLLGDFNFAPGENEGERMLIQAGFRDVGTAPTWVPRNPFTGGSAPARLDRIWVRGGWNVLAANVLPRVWSDHQPIHAVLSLAT